MKIFSPCVAIFLCLAFPAHAQDQAFATWLEGVKKDARSQGISAGAIAALDSVEPVERVIELDRKQPESQITLDEYLEKTITKPRIREGREKYQEFRETLQAVSQKYGVPPNVILALWGVETSYGDNTGGFDTLSALATLAYDGRRSDYFRGELINALWILDGGHIDTANFQGSWAGAMGQCQFMPTSFLKYAVDFDGDGKRDIWNDEADIFASIANYLHSEGWNSSEDIEEDGNNFKVLLKWNRSRYFVTAVSNLANAIGEK